MSPRPYFKIREEDLIVKPRQPMRTFLRFFAMIIPHWHMMLLVVVLDFLTSPFPLLTALLGRVMVDNILLNTAAPTSERIRDFVLLTLAIGAINELNVFVKGGFFEGAGLNHFFGKYLGIRVRLTLRKRVYHHLHRLPMSFFQRRPIGEHAYRILADTGGIFFGPDAVSLATSTVPQLVTIANQTFLAVIYLSVVSPMLVFIVCLYVFPKVFFLHYFTTFVQRRTFLARQKQQLEPAVLRESIAGAQTIKSFGQSRRELRKFVSILVEARRRGVAIMWFTILRDRIQNSVDLIFGVGLFAFVGYKTVMGEYTIGEFTAISMIVRGIPQPLIQAVHMIQSIRMDLVMGERILQTLDEPATNVDKPKPVRLRGFSGAIEMRDVAFTYPDGTEVLRGVNLRIEPGESLAIVGPSGEGKTTLLHTLLRVHRPTGGAILADGIDLKDICLGDLIKSSGIVMQETHLFLGDILSNLKYPWPLATQADVEEAARIADIHDFIMSLPDGYRTDMREGTRLSGGQRQRLGIARALVGRPRLLLFDEPTSSLDTRTEVEVWDAMRKAMQGRTSVIVTHRLPTARTADRIAVLAKGVIAETGTHRELLEKQGIYAAMWNQQFHNKGDGRP